MYKPAIFSAVFCLLFHAAPAAAAELTPMETRWLKASAPVLAYSRQLGLPIDIVVQPQAGPNDVPMAMGFAEQRCKLVLTMRGSGDAEAILAGLAPEQATLMIEAMAAHEIGHCWRYARGVWHALPAGFVEQGADGSATPGAERLATLQREMREMRREEGFSDLVALAWTAQRHPQQYAAVQAWMHKVRSDQRIALGGHDTLNWVARAGDPAVFKAGATPFETVDQVWTAGLLDAD